MADPITKKKPSEGRVNVPLGSRKKELAKHAKTAGTNETALARTLILYCLDRMAKGDLKFSGPSIEEGGSK